MSAIQHVLAIVAIAFSLLVYVILAVAALVLGTGTAPGSSAPTLPEPGAQHTSSAEPPDGSTDVPAA